MVPHLAEVALRNKTLAWLLEFNNPSARYLTLTKVLDRSEETQEVRDSRAAIPQAAPARDILLAQYPQGYWMHPGIGCSPRYRATLWQILILAQLGMPRCPAVDRAVDHLFEANQREDGAFRASKEPGDVPMGLNGSLLWALERLGYGEATAVERAWSWLAGEIETHGLESRGVGRESPTQGAVKVLWAANAVPPNRRYGGLELVSREAAAFLLDASPDRRDGETIWSRLTFPLTEGADLLQWMAVLVDAGYGDDPRLAPARSWLAPKRRPDGAWPLERVPGKLWADVGALDEPNKWVTIRALAVSL